MKRNSVKMERILTVLLALVAVLFIFCNAVAAVSVTADTSGLTGKTGDTVRVPVTVTDMSEIGAYQVIVGIKDDDTAKIEVDTTTLRGATSDVHGLVMYSANDDLDGTEPLFELLVTPKTADDVTIELRNVLVYTPALSNAGATAASSILTVEGEGSGNTIDDENQGVTASSESTDDNGKAKTGFTEGVSEVEIPGHENEPVVVYKETATQQQASGNIDDDDDSGIQSDGTAAPAGVKYFFSNKVYTPTTGGEAYQIYMLLPKEKLSSAGKTTDDLFILHLADGTWYEVPITSIESQDNFVKVKFTAWSSGNYVLAYDAGGQTFPTENAGVTTEPTIVPEEPISSEPQNVNTDTPSYATPVPTSSSSVASSSSSSSSLDITKPPLLYVLIGGGVAVIAVIVIIIVVRSWRKRYY